MAARIIKGEVKLLIDGLGLEAALHFIPNPDGMELGSDSITKLLSQEKLGGVSARRIDEVMDLFSRAKEATTEVLLRGHPPVPGISESAEWLAHETPEEYKAFINELLEEAAAPELFRIRTEKIAREIVIKKPQALPFLPPKTEKRVEYEKIERKDPVFLDTKVNSVFWVKKTEVIAKINAAQAGKAGKNVYGKAIAPPPMEDNLFYLGQGLERGKGEIIALKSGFVRAGERWADLISFGPGSYELSVSENGTTVLLNYEPGDKRLSPPDATAILKEAAELSKDEESLIDEEELSAVLLRSTRSGQALHNYSLSNDRDAEVKISVSLDKLKATMNIIKGRGKGKALELSMVSAAMAGCQIKGIKVDKLKSDVINFYRSKESELLDYVLSEGKEAVKGKDRSLVFTVAFLPDEQLKSYVNSIEALPALSRYTTNLENFPIKETSQLAMVKKNQDIARFGPPSSGQNGLNVYGHPIQATPGNDPPITLFDKLKISQESIVSEDDGILLVDSSEEGKKLRVLPYKDAKVSVKVSEDGMTASLSLERAYGLGKELNLELVKGHLEKAGVKNGVDLQELGDALTKAKENGAAENIIVARGTSPVPAGGYRLSWITKLASGAMLTVRSDGSVDYKNQDRVTVVNAGQVLLELEPIGETGHDGMDVLGNIITASKDPDLVEPPVFDSTIEETINENGSRILKAAKSGELHFENNNLYIDPAKQIKGDIGPNTGNIKFPGPITINGSVLSAYAVIAGGDILVNGSVEAALLSADGGIKITEGIKGQRKGTIRARTTIEAAFAEQATLLAVDGIILKNSAFMCNIKTNGKVQLLGEKGHLIGGFCKTKKGMEIQNLGSSNGAKTLISFGQDYLVKDAIETEEREIERVKTMVLETDKTMKEQERIGANLDKIRQDKLKLMKILEKRSLRLFELREKFEEHFPAEIVVKGSAFIGVVLESHNRFHEIRQEKKQVVFYFDPQLGRIMERTLK
ncbi:hypothetical protein MASR2M29_00440 [Spirochaetota bacterium]